MPDMFAKAGYYDFTINNTVLLDWEKEWLLLCGVDEHKLATLPVGLVWSLYGDVLVWGPDAAKVKAWLNTLNESILAGDVTLLENLFRAVRLSEPFWAEHLMRFTELNLDWIEQARPSTLGPRYAKQPCYAQVWRLDSTFEDAYDILQRSYHDHLWNPYKDEVEVLESISATLMLDLTSFLYILSGRHIYPEGSELSQLQRLLYDRVWNSVMEVDAC